MPRPARPQPRPIVTLGAEPQCLDCLAPLWVDRPLRAWVCPSGCAHGTFETVGGREVRVSIGRRA